MSHVHDCSTKDCNGYFECSLDCDDEQDRVCYECLAQEVNKLRKVVRQVHALTHKALVTDWRVGLTKETLTEIHKITKGMVE